MSAIITIRSVAQDDHGSMVSNHNSPVIMSFSVCPGFSGVGKVPNEMIMTDGCGLVTSNVLISIQKRLGWPSEPTAVQMRLGGAKVWISIVSHVDEAYGSTNQ